MDNEETEKLRSIFMPEYRRHFDELVAGLARGESPRFAYYTSAETAAKVIQNRELWMRMTSTMNDYSEVHHGLECIRGAWVSASGGRLKAALASVGPQIVESAVAQFDRSLNNLTQGTFIACVSRHLPEEDELGRLSMWRAYGGSAGVALVFKGEAFAGSAGDSGFSSSPVHYGNQKTVEAVFDEVAGNVVREAAYLRSLDSGGLAGWFTMALQFGVVCVKHPGFKEEQEWRVIHVDGLDGKGGLDSRVETIRGTPQLIKAIKLEEPPVGGIPGISIPKLLDRVIIGPSDHIQATRAAFFDLLEKCGVTNIPEKVVVSGIPLRMAK